MTPRSWIMAFDGSDPQEPFGFGCMRCGRRELVPRPIPVPDFLKRAKAFQKNHGRCKATKP
jgi:hypothetical protein